VLQAIKEAVVAHLEAKGWKITDLGDYPLKLEKKPE
jgi:hypothetical protein